MHVIFPGVICPGKLVPYVPVSCALPCLALPSDQGTAFRTALYSPCACEYVVGSCSGNCLLGPGAAEQLTQCSPEKTGLLLTKVMLEQQEGGENEQKCHPLLP